MYYFYWLMSKSALAYDMAEYSQTGGDRVGRVKEM